LNPLLEVFLIPFVAILIFSVKEFLFLYSPSPSSLPRPFFIFEVKETAQSSFIGGEPFSLENLLFFLPISFQAATFSQKNSPPHPN